MTALIRSRTLLLSRTILALCLCDGISQLSCCVSLERRSLAHLLMMMQLNAADRLMANCATQSALHHLGYSAPLRPVKSNHILANKPEACRYISIGPCSSKIWITTGMAQKLKYKDFYNRDDQNHIKRRGMLEKLTKNQTRFRYLRVSCQASIASLSSSALSTEGLLIQDRICQNHHALT